MDRNIGSRPISEREAVIRDFVRQKWETRSNIARHLGMSKHPALVRLIEEMVIDDILVRRLSETNKGAPIYYYRAKGAE